MAVLEVKPRQMVSPSRMKLSADGSSTRWWHCAVVHVGATWHGVVGSRVSVDIAVSVLLPVSRSLRKSSMSKSVSSSSAVVDGGDGESGVMVISCSGGSRAVS